MNTRISNNMKFSISKPNSNGHVIIKIKEFNKECGYIMFKPLPHIIELTSIACNCPSTLGKSMNILLGKMIDYCMKIGSNDDMRVELMVEPDEDFLRNTHISPKTGISKLKAHYRKFGFENDPTEPRLTEYMISTIGLIKSKIHYTKIPQFNLTRSKVSKSISRKKYSKIPVAVWRKTYKSNEL